MHKTIQGTPKVPGYDNLEFQDVLQGVKSANMPRYGYFAHEKPPFGKISEA